MEGKKLKVVLFSRKPRPLGNFSVESYFETMADLLSTEFDVKLDTMPYESNGLLPRVLNALYCFFRQGDINHITGDIHYVAALLRKRKTVLTVLDCGMLNLNRGWKLQILKLFWFTIPARRVSLITTISSATKTELLKHISFDPDRIRVVHVCVPRLYRKIPPPERSGMEAVRILQIGTAPNKNIVRLIDALVGLNVCLTIIGKPDQATQKKLIQSGVRYVVKDWKLTNEEMLQAYVECDILSLVSTIEGFGMPIVEANKVGRVVVTSNVYSMPEIAGDAAILVNPLDVNSIRHGILLAMSNNMLRQKIVGNGYKNAERFDSIPIAKAYADIYREMEGDKLIK